LQNKLLPLPTKVFYLMITNEFLKPRSIVVVGGSEDIHKPGGKVLKNLIDNGFKGKLYVVNPKAETIQGQPAFHRVEDLPQVDVAILAIRQPCVPQPWNVCARQKKQKELSFSRQVFQKKTVKEPKGKRRCAILPTGTGPLSSDQTASDT
jgi:acetyltransferase